MTEHDRFLYEKDGFLHFGCINPFCGHGNPLLPNHYKIPLETNLKDGGAVKIKLLSHKNGMLELELTHSKTNKKTIMSCADNLYACVELFDIKIKELV